MLSENGPDVFRITDIYKLNEGFAETVRVRYGNWSSINGLIAYEPNIWKRRSNFRGYNFR